MNVLVTRLPLEIAVEYEPRKDAEPELLRILLGDLDITQAMSASDYDAIVSDLYDKAVLFEVAK